MIKKYSIFFIGLIICCGLTGCGKSNESGLPNKDSFYDKICTLKQSSEGYEINMTFGLYQKDGKFLHDNAFVWSADEGKIELKDDSKETELVNAFATLTAMTVQFDGDTSNANNYYKNNKVYITNTTTYNSNEYADIDALEKDFTSLGASCK